MPMGIREQNDNTQSKKSFDTLHEPLKADSGLIPSPMLDGRSSNNLRCAAPTKGAGVFRNLKFCNIGQPKTQNSFFSLAKSSLIDTIRLSAVDMKKQPPRTIDRIIISVKSGS